MAIVTEPAEIDAGTEAVLRAAATQIGASDVEIARSGTLGKPVVSFVLDAMNEHAALTVGHEAVRNVVGDGFGEGVTLAEGDQVGG